jgi:hypothetical protein
MFRRICKPFILLASTLLLVSVASADPAASSGSTTALLQKAVNGNWRSTAHKARISTGIPSRRCNSSASSRT